MKYETGFTLIEVLIAMLVLAVGLLGLAGLQATGLRNNLSAYNRSQATQLAYDMADRMRANVANARNFGASVYITKLPTAANVQNDCKQVTTTCTTADLAENDLFEWNCAIAGCSAEVGPPAMPAIPATLPSGTGSITVVPATGIFTITINWDDNRDGCVNPGDANVACAGLDDDPNFQVRIQL
ncbi:MAG: type IV pilus modification protein PilV [Methylococcaceae bacterium]|nr:type IV pilus modification protein PilV [Methylococcaceae bacterium]